MMSDFIFFLNGKRLRGKEEKETGHLCGRCPRGNKIRVKQKCLINHKVLEVALWIDMESSIMSLCHKIYCSYISGT